MATRTLNANFYALILITPIFLGSLLLLIDIPIFNYVSPLSLFLAVFGLCVGLVFGIATGLWYTGEQLRILSVNNEFKGIGSKKIRVAIAFGFAIFLGFSFFTLYFDVRFVMPSFILFVISATFALPIARLIMVRSWEKKEMKIVMQEWNKFFVIPNPPPPQ